MPRIMWYREETRGNWFDSFDLSLAGKVERLFGNANIGDAALTNLVVPSCIAYDQTAILNNWYARTTIPRTPDFDLWAHSAVVTLWVGEKPLWTKFAYDLLRAGPWVPPHRHGKQTTEAEAADMVLDGEAKFARFQVVPVRQNTKVTVHSDPDALAVAARGCVPVEQGGRAGKLARLTSRIWIHLEGVSRRDVP